MKHFYLLRDKITGDGLGGVMTDGKDFTVQTLENAERRIPDGTYKCVRDYYHRGDYETFEVQVEGRDRILIHGANYPHQLEGCIAPGESRGVKDGSLAVWQSKAAFGRYMDALVGHDTHVLHIKTKVAEDE